MLSRRSFISLLAAPLLAARRVPVTAAESHRHADLVEIPRFAAAFNDWRNGHPSSKEEEHYLKLDAKDVKFYHVAREAWRAVEKAMQEAGY